MKTPNRKDAGSRPVALPPLRQSGSSGSAPLAPRASHGLLGWLRRQPSRVQLDGRLRAPLCLLLSLSSLCGGCGNRESLGVSALSVVSAGVVNDPSNKSLRFDLLKFGLDRFCVEMLRRGAPIKLGDHEPVLGRFFADGCQAQVIDQADRQSVVVRYSGKGYGWTNLSQRLGFSSTGLVEYAVDFEQHAQRMYIYFRPRSVGEATFQTLLLESAVAQVGLGLSGVDAESLGKELIQRQLARGFTVIRHSARGEVEFSPGLVPVGQEPFKPFQVLESEKATLDNDRTEIHAGQQDFIGGVYVAAGEKRLYLTLSLDGAARVDVFLVPEVDGRNMVQAYVTTRGAAALPRAPLIDAELGTGQPLRLELNIPPGGYYLVFDHSVGVGRSNPAAGADAAKIDYLVQLGDR